MNLPVNILHPKEVLVRKGVISCQPDKASVHIGAKSIGYSRYRNRSFTYQLVCGQLIDSRELGFLFHVDLESSCRYMNCFYQQSTNTDKSRSERNNECIASGAYMS